MLLAYAVALLVPAIVLRQAEPLPEGLSPAPPAIGAPAPDRVEADLARQATPAGYAREVEARLASRGFAVFRQRVLRDENVAGIHPGRSEAMILLVAPLEPGDPASLRAAAAVLAAAEALAGNTTATLLVLLEAGSRSGHLGAAVFARTFAAAGRIIAGLGVGPLPAGSCLPALGAAGQPHGYAPIWLRRTAVAVAAAEGATLADATGVGEWFARAGGRATGPHGPLLAGRVPSVTYECGQTGYASAHMATATAPPVMRASRLAVRFVRTLDGADLPPREARPAVTVSADAQIPETRARAALGMAFMPLWMAATLAVARSGRRAGALRRSLGAFAVRLAPLLFALLGLWALPTLGGWRDVPPAPAPDLPLPPLQPLLLVGAGAALVWLVLRPARRFFAGLTVPPGDRTALLRSQVPAELVALSLAAGYALLVNPYAAAILLLPAAWLWPLAVGGPGSALLTLLGGTGVMTLAIGAGIVTGLDWRIAPYFLETLAAGGWSAAAGLAGLLAVGAGLGGLARSFR